MAAAARSGFMKGKAEMPSRIVMTAIVVLLLFAMWRHYEPPNRDIAFPAGEIVIGVDGSFPPFALDDGGRLRGLDLDLGNAIAAEIGLPARFVNISYYGLYDALISGEVDLLISALRIDPARMDALRYTQPYFDNGLMTVTAPFLGPLNPAALDGGALAYEYASSADSQIRAWEAEGHSYARMPFELPRHALDAVRLSQADAALIDASTLYLYAREHANWDHRREFATREPFAIALRLDRDDAWKLVDQSLSALKESGELARIVGYWL